MVSVLGSLGRSQSKGAQLQYTALNLNFGGEAICLFVNCSFAHEHTHTHTHTHTHSRTYTRTSNNYRKISFEISQIHTIVKKLVFNTFSRVESKFLNN